MSEPEDSEEPERESTLPPARRAAGGPRTPANDPVVFVASDRRIEGWMLNQSAGGLRVVLEDDVAAGESYLATVGDEAEARPVRVVWVRSAKGGIVAGVAFEDVEGEVPPEDTAF